MAHTVTTHAIVLRVVPYREHHRILTLFSPEYGRLTAVAHGALGAKSKLRSAAVPFANGEYVLSGTDGRWSVSSFLPDSSYYGGMEEYESIVCAGVLGAFCEAVIQEEQPAPGLYAILMEALAYLNFSEFSRMELLCRYLLKMLDETGFAPEMSRCNLCGADRGIPMLSFEAGGLCCKRCRPHAAPLPAGGAAFLRSVRENDPAVRPPEPVALLVRALIAYAQDALGQNLRPAALLETMFSAEDTTETVL